jgi:putative ABC transport system ATP-binding protein
MSVDARARLDAAAVEAIDLSRIYSTGRDAVSGLHHVSFSVRRGEVVAVTGPSGSGKSTLLYLLGGLDEPDSGTVMVAGVDWTSLQGDDRARFRRRSCGFIVQGFTLLPQATASENVDVPLVLDGVSTETRRARVAAALERVGLADEAHKLPDQLSGGQQQRVSIARALVGEPAVVLADEPTGNLDSETAEAVTKLLVSVAPERGAAVVIVTHDPTVADHADRIVAIHSGRIDVAGAGGDAA